MTKLNIDSKVRMNSGYEIPLLGYGVYQTPATECQKVTHHAIESGYRHVDSATVYRNEEPAAKGMLQSGGIPREQLFFTSKVPPRSINYEDAKKCVNESLRKTGLDYIDLYLLHAPYGGKDGRLGAWKGLVECVAEGKVRSIGYASQIPQSNALLTLCLPVSRITACTISTSLSSGKSLNLPRRPAY